MKKILPREKESSAEEVKFREPLWFCLVCGFGGGAFFGGAGVYLIKNAEQSHHMLIGIFSIILTTTIIFGLFFEWRNAYLLVTREGLLECDLFSHKKFMPWTECSDVYKYRSGYFKDLVFERRFRLNGQRKWYQFSSKEVRTDTISIPTFFIDQQKKDQLSQIVAASDLAPKLKEKFFEIVN